MILLVFGSSCCLAASTGTPAEVLEHDAVVLLPVSGLHDLVEDSLQHARQRSVCAEPLGGTSEA